MRVERGDTEWRLRLCLRELELEPRDLAARREGAERVDRRLGEFVAAVRGAEFSEKGRVGFHRGFLSNNSRPAWVHVSGNVRPGGTRSTLRDREP